MSDLRILLRDCRDGLILAENTSIDAIDSAGLITRLHAMLDETRRPGLNNPVTRFILLEGHTAMVAALQLCAMIDDDNRAVVMVRGYGEDFEEWTGIYLSEYSLDEIIDDDSWFSDYEDPQIWVSTECATPRANDERRA